MEVSETLNRITGAVEKYGKPMIGSATSEIRRSPQSHMTHSRAPATASRRRRHIAPTRVSASHFELFPSEKVTSFSVLVIIKAHCPSVDLDLENWVFIGMSNPMHAPMMAKGMPKIKTAPDIRRYKIKGSLASGDHPGLVGRNGYVPWSITERATKSTRRTALHDSLLNSLTLVATKRF